MKITVALFQRLCKAVAEQCIKRQPAKVVKWKINRAILRYTARQQAGRAAIYSMSKKNVLRFFSTQTCTHWHPHTHAQSLATHFSQFSFFRQQNEVTQSVCCRFPCESSECQFARRQLLLFLILLRSALCAGAARDTWKFLEARFRCFAFTVYRCFWIFLGCFVLRVVFSHSSFRVFFVCSALLLFICSVQSFYPSVFSCCFLVVYRVMNVVLMFNVYAPIFMLSVSHDFMIFRIFLALSVRVFLNIVPAVCVFQLFCRCATTKERIKVMK